MGSDPMSKHVNKCDECGKAFGLVRHRFWPYQYCSKKCRDRGIAEYARRLREFWQKLNKKQDGSNME